MMNSSEGSRKLDAVAGLENYVRLSFCELNPMVYVALREKRIKDPVLLEIDLQVVSRPGVLFSDCNATRTGSIQSIRPTIVRFEIVKACSQRDVPVEERPFYQAEVLVPSPLPPHLITIPLTSMKLFKERSTKTSGAVKLAWTVSSACDDRARRGYAERCDPATVGTAGP